MNKMEILTMASFKFRTKMKESGTFDGIAEEWEMKKKYVCLRSEEIDVLLDQENKSF